MDWFVFAAAGQTVPERVSRRVGELARSGPGAGVHVEHPTAERHGPLPLVCYALGRRRDGIPALVTHHHPGLVLGANPGAEARRRRLCLI